MPFWALAKAKNFIRKRKKAKNGTKITHRNRRGGASRHPATQRTPKYQAQVAGSA